MNAPDKSQKIPLPNVPIQLSCTISHKVSIVQSDITKLNCQSIVNAAKGNLQGGGGVDGAIHIAAGSQLRKYCAKRLSILGWKECPVGEAVITPSFRLSTNSIQYIVHTVGPQDGNGTLLANCYTNSLQLMISNNYGENIRSIAFPCIATNIYGFDNTLACHIALRTVKQWLESNSSYVDKIIFCAFNDLDFTLYTKNIQTYFPDYQNSD